jgi:hypothetical protein
MARLRLFTWLLECAQVWMPETHLSSSSAAKGANVTVEKVCITPQPSICRASKGQKQPGLSVLSARA